MCTYSHVWMHRCRSQPARGHLPRTLSLTGSSLWRRGLATLQAAILCVVRVQAVVSLCNNSREGGGASEDDEEGPNPTWQYQDSRRISAERHMRERVYLQHAARGSSGYEQYGVGRSQMARRVIDSRDILFMHS